MPEINTYNQKAMMVFLRRKFDEDEEPEKVGPLQQVRVRVLVLLYFSNQRV